MDKKLLATMLKELEEKKDIIMSNYDLDKETFSSYIDAMKANWLAENVSVTRGGQGNLAQAIFATNGRVTLKGSEFIEKHLK